jgi:hypothetical protein
MNDEERIVNLENKMSEQGTEIQEMKREAKAWNECYEDLILELRTDLTFAHQMINYLLDQNPRILGDIRAMEKIVGPFGQPLKGAPLLS